MTAAMKSLVVSLGLLSTIGTSIGHAQTPRPGTDTQAISRGWASLAAGRSSEAVSIADGILKRKPRSHAAFTLKIEALAAGTQPLTALDAYEAWIPKGGGNVDDRGLLQPIAAGLLRALSTDSDVAVRNAALKFLAAAGDDSATEALRKAGAAGDQRAMLALIDQGDATAIASLQALVGSGAGRDMSAAIKSLSEHGGLTAEMAQTLAKDRVPMNRAALAEALASSKDSGAQQILESLSQDPDPLVHSSVTLAKAKSGDERAVADARAMLASEVPDIRLTAAEALVDSMPRESEQAVRPLLTDRDGNNRFRAAAIVGRFDPAAVQSVLMEGLAHQSPLIQQEAARVVGDALPGDTVLLRQLLRHPDRTIVVQAAGALLTN
jgi:HEAT repeat protein